MPKWQYTKGLQDLGNGCYAWLQPDGSWGYSNSGLIVDEGETLLVDTLFDLRLTRAMLDGFRGWTDAERIVINVNTLYREFSGSSAPMDAEEHLRAARALPQRARRARTLTDRRSR